MCTSIAVAATQHFSYNTYEQVGGIDCPAKKQNLIITSSNGLTIGIKQASRKRLGHLAFIAAVKHDVHVLPVMGPRP